MARNGIIQVRILGDQRGLVKALAEADSSIARFSGSVESYGNKVSKWLGRGVLAGVAVGVGAIGTAIKGGFERLQTIDAAEGKLRGLGHSTQEIAAIMDSALASVRGTAFGLGDAATVAATAVAAGVQPGADLARYLSLIGDTATIAGAGLDEIGSIINKATTSQRVYTQELNQLADRGLPVFTWLQDEYGVTAEELRKMVSAGEVDTARFLDVIERNIGGAALESGNTFAGAFANMRAAMSRFGAELIGPVFNRSRQWFGSITSWIDDLTEQARELVPVIVDAVGGWLRSIAPAARKWIDRIRVGFNQLVKVGRQVVRWARENRELIERIVKAVIPAVAAVSAFALVLAKVKAAFVLLTAATPVGAIMAAAAAIIYAYQNSERFREVVQQVAAKVREHWPQIQRTMQTVIEWIRDNVVPVIEAVVGFIAVEFGKLVGWVRENWEDIRETIAGVIEAVQVIVETVLAVIRVAWETWGDTLVRFAAERWEQIKQLIQAAIEIVRGIINTVTALIRGDWSGVWNGLKTIVSGVWEAIKTIVSAAVSNVKLVLSLAWDAIKAVASGAWNAVKDTVSGTWGAIKSVVRRGVEDIIGFVVSLPRRIKDAVMGAFDAIWDQFKGVINRIIRGWNALNFTLPEVSIDWNGPLPGGNVTIGGWTIGVPRIPELATGAVVGAPMLAMVGEYAGARQNPEIVAPQRTLAKVFREELDLWSPTVQVWIGNEPVDARVRVAMGGVAGSVRAGRRG